MPNVRLKRAPRYTPVSKRQDKPDAVYWIIRNHPEFADADIIKLIGTTKATIQKIRERSHWNATNIKAVDPVTLGLCSQLELDLAVTRAAAKHERAQKRAAKKGATLKPVTESLAPAPAERRLPPKSGSPVNLRPTAMSGSCPANSSRTERRLQVAQGDKAQHHQHQKHDQRDLEIFLEQLFGFLAEEMDQQRLPAR